MVDRLLYKLKLIVEANLLLSVWGAITAGIIRTGDVMAEAMSSFEHVRNAPDVDAAPVSLE